LASAAAAAASAADAKAAEAAILAVWRDAGDALRDARIKAALQQQAQQGATALVKNGGGHMTVGETIEFQKADIVSPDGRLLVTDLNFSVPRGTNVMVTGAWCHFAREF
jgi:ABC-type uncharacterized transport system fused permease/ATPase subunit